MKPEKHDSTTAFYGEPSRANLRDMQRLKSDTTYQKKLQAITRKSEKLDAEAITLYVVWYFSPARLTRAQWEKVWASNTGKEWKALREFPDRLNGVAEELERLSNSLFPPPRLLPVLMRLYANQLKRTIDLVPGESRKHYPQLDDKMWLMTLSEMAKSATGQVLDRQIADLLCAAATVLDKSCNLDEQKITQARYYRLRKQKT